jgi:hypothetical protein
MDLGPQCLPSPKFFGAPFISSGLRRFLQDGTARTAIKKNIERN